MLGASSAEVVGLAVGSGGPHGGAVFAGVHESHAREVLMETTTVASHGRVRHHGVVTGSSRQSCVRLDRGGAEHHAHNGHTQRRAGNQRFTPRTGVAGAANDAARRQGFAKIALCAQGLSPIIVIRSFSLVHWVTVTD